MYTSVSLKLIEASQTGGSDGATFKFFRAWQWSRTSDKDLDYEGEISFRLSKPGSTSV